MDAHLALFVRGYVGNDEDVGFQSGLAEGQYLVQSRIPLDDPQPENLADVQQGIGIAVLLLQLGRLPEIADAAGDDPVNQRTAEGARLVDILLKSVFQSPLFAVPVYTCLQFLAVVVDELAGEDEDALLACPVAAVEHLGQLAGEGGTGLIGEPAGGIVDDTRLGGVGHDDFQIVAGGDRHHLLEAFLLIGVQTAGHGRNDPLFVHPLTVATASQVQGVQPLLFIDLLGQTGRDGLHQNALAVPAGLFIGQVKPVVRESPQKIALAELQNLLRRLFQKIAGVTRLF